MISIHLYKNLIWLSFFHYLCRLFRYFLFGLEFKLANQYLQSSYKNVDHLITRNIPHYIWLLVARYLFLYTHLFNCKCEWWNDLLRWKKKMEFLVHFSENFARFAHMKIEKTLRIGEGVNFFQPFYFWYVIELPDFTEQNRWVTMKIKIIIVRWILSTGESSLLYRKKLRLQF